MPSVQRVRSTVDKIRARSNAPLQRSNASSNEPRKLDGRVYFERFSC